MDANQLFYITLIFASPLFFALGRKLVALVFGLLGLSELKITAVLKNGDEREVTIDLEDQSELSELLREIQKEQAGKGRQRGGVGH